VVPANTVAPRAVYRYVSRPTDDATTGAVGLPAAKGYRAGVVLGYLDDRLPSRTILTALVVALGPELRRTPLLGCEYPGEWLWATSWTGLTLLLGEPKGALQVTRRPDTLVSPDGRPGPECRDLIGARR
jgi:hypothetical protein